MESEMHDFITVILAYKVVVLAVMFSLAVCAAYEIYMESK